MVAFRFRAYKAPHHFVFFGGDRNDNNTEIPAAGDGRAGTGRDGTARAPEPTWPDPGPDLAGPPTSGGDP